MAKCASSPNPIISKDILRSEVRRKHTKKVEWRVSAEWSAKSGVHEGWVQKGKCRQGTHYALRRKHARWPATTCGSLTRIPPGQGLGLLRSPTSTKTEQQWDPNRPHTGPIWPSGGGKGQPKINTNIKSIKNANVKNPNKKKVVFEIWCDFLKNRRAQRLGVYLGFFNKCDTNDIWILAQRKADKTEK